MTDLYVQPGSEKYVKFAKTKLIGLSALRADLRLEILQKHYVPESGIRIDIMSSDAGDRIRIFGSSLFLVRGTASATKTYDRAFKLLRTSTSGTPIGPDGEFLRLGDTGSMYYGLTDMGGGSWKVTFRPLTKDGIPFDPVVDTSATLGIGVIAVIAPSITKNLALVYTSVYPTADFLLKSLLFQPSGVATILSLATPWQDNLYISPTPAKIPGNVVGWAVGGQYIVAGVPASHAVALVLGTNGVLGLTILASAPIDDRPGNGQWATLYLPGAAQINDSMSAVWYATRDNRFLASPGVLQYTMTARLNIGGAEVDHWTIGTSSSANEQGVAKGFPANIVTGISDTGNTVVYAVDVNSGGFLKVYRGGVITKLRDIGVGDVPQKVWATNNGNRVVMLMNSTLYFYKYTDATPTTPATGWAISGIIAMASGTPWFNPISGRVLSTSGATAYSYLDGVEKVEPGFPTGSISVQDLFTSKI